jgi:hypothetical protein
MGLLRFISALSVLNVHAKVPQAWTLSMELYFICSHHLVRHGYVFLFGVMAVSFSLRVLAAVLFGLRTDPRSYRFFPFELLFFLAGVIAYRLGKPQGQPGQAKP